MEEAILKTVEFQGYTTIYLDIPRIGSNASMLLIEALIDLEIGMTKPTYYNDDYFRIHLNVEKSKIERVRDYINNNL